MAHSDLYLFVSWLSILAVVVCLIVTTISSPVVGHIAILQVNLPQASGNSSITFGTFGYCFLDSSNGTTHKFCSGKSIGYNPTHIVDQINGTAGFGSTADSLNGLTKAMILHPICTGLAFVILIMDAVTGNAPTTINDFKSESEPFTVAIVPALAWVLTLVVTVIDFMLFRSIKDHVNEGSNGSHAFYTTGMWTLLNGAIFLFFRSIAAVVTILGIIIKPIVNDLCSFIARHRRPHPPAIVRDNDGYVKGGRQRRSFGFV